MTWIEKYKRVWRVAIIMLLVLAIFGPWTFDHIWVPSEYSCSPPNIRLDDDFCGLPMSGIWLYTWVVCGITYSSEILITGELVFTEWIREFLFSLLLFLTLLPIFSTLLLILRGDHQRRQIFTIVACCLAIGVGLLWGMNNYPKVFWVVWGIWLYIGLTTSALILEMLTLSEGRRFSQG